MCALTISTAAQEPAEAQMVYLQAPTVSVPQQLCHVGTGPEGSQGTVRQSQHLETLGGC